MTAPQQYGPIAGEPGTPERYRWDTRTVQVQDAQEMNSKAVHEMAAMGIAGADGVALMARLNGLIDFLFGDTTGNPGILTQTEHQLIRLDLELHLQQRISSTLAGARAMAEQALRASGQPHRTSGGIILPGRGSN
jgi:hypothetical protein